MKRKFLAKAITLGLMLAVPFGVEAREATGVIINNVDGKTVSDVSGDVKIDINNSITVFDQVNGVNGSIVGLGITNEDILNTDSIKITNSVTNDVTQYFIDNKKNTEVNGLYNQNGKLITNFIDIDLKVNHSGNSVILDDGTNRDAYIGVFGISAKNKTGTSIKDEIKPEIIVNGDVNINIEGYAKKSYLQGFCLQDSDGAIINIDGTTRIDIKDKNPNNIQGGATGINIPNGESIFNAKDVIISIDGSIEQYGISTNSLSTVNLKNVAIKLANATKKSTGFNCGLSETTFKDLEIIISNVDKIEDITNISGINFISASHNTSITGNVNIYVEKGYAINASKGLTKDFELGADENKTVSIKGNIINTDNSKKSIILNLNNAQSSFEGATTGKVDLNLKEKSTWTNTGDSTVNNLTLKGANLVQANDSATITKANGGKFEIKGDNTIALNTTSNGTTMNASTTLFANDAFAESDVDSGTTIKLTSANQNAGDISKENAADSFNNLRDALGDSNLKSKVTFAHLDGSYTTNDIDAKVGTDGKFENSTVTQSDADTETIAAIKKLPSINLISWRTENNELSKRLGEVRDYAGEEGIWARMNHGESKYLDSFKTKSHLYQMGYDKKVGEWRLGGAVSYNKGTTTYENGNGKNRSTSLALYGAWLGDKGHYADIIVKEGKQKSDMTIGQTGKAASNLDYDLWATSISAEYGRKIALKSDWFVEPQAELTYGRLGSVDYGDNGFSVHQDSMDSLVGRMGFRLGKNLSDASNIYMKASVLHEFCGDVDYSFTEGTNHKVSSADLGDTWYEVGVGGSAQIGKATYAYAGIEKTFGGDFSTPWQWNAGVRWSF